MQYLLAFVGLIVVLGAFRGRRESSPADHHQEDEKVADADPFREVDFMFDDN